MDATLKVRRLARPVLDLGEGSAGDPANFDEFKPKFGESYEEDYCRDKEPGPPLGFQPSTFSALNRDLPEARIELGPAAARPGDVP